MRPRCRPHRTVAARAGPSTGPIMTAAATLSRALPGHRADYGNCGDPDDTWDEDRQSSRIVEKRRAGAVWQHCDQQCPPVQVTRPTGERISQKSGSRSTVLPHSHRSPLFFSAQYPLTRKKQPSYTSSHRKQCLIKYQIDDQMSAISKLDNEGWSGGGSAGATPSLCAEDGRRHPLRFSRGKVRKGSAAPFHVP